MSGTNELTGEILLAASREGHRLFRQNVGQAWVGEVVKRDPKFITLSEYRPFHAGLATGSGDCIGLTKEGIFASLEIKWGQDRVRKGQPEWIAMVRSLGGRAGVVRSVEEALAVLRGEVL